MPASVNPLTRAWHAVWRPTPRSLRVLALLGVIGNAGIVATGGAVRVTKSGLGCPTWPRCTGDSFVPTAHADHAAINMAIEFGNRMLTFAVLAVGLAVFVAALRLRPRRRDVLLLALAQPMSVVAQAIIGGIVVLTKLHPASVSVHFLISPTLLIFCVALWVRAGEGDAPPRPLVPQGLRRLSLALAAAIWLVLAAGTVVTGTGPHSGDTDSRRYGFSIEDVARVHALLAWATVILSIAVLLWVRRADAPRATRRWALALLGLLVAQGAIGYVQYFLGVPGALVVLHMAVSVILWIVGLRLYLSMRDRGPLAATAPPARDEHQPVPA